MKLRSGARSESTRSTASDWMMAMMGDASLRRIVSWIPLRSASVSLRDAGQTPVRSFTPTTTRSFGGTATFRVSQLHQSVVRCARHGQVGHGSLDALTDAWTSPRIRPIVEGAASIAVWTTLELDYVACLELANRLEPGVRRKIRDEV